MVPRIRKDISVEFFFDACLVDCTDTSWSILFLTMNNIALIIAEQKTQKQARNNVLPYSIKWVYETKTI